MDTQEHVKLKDIYGNRGSLLHEPVTEEGIRELLTQAHKEGLHVAVESGGTKRLAYGSGRDLVIGLRVVYPDGRIIRTGGRS